MEQMNFHKQKLYSLIAAGVALIACFLPWMSGKAGIGFSVNGLHSWGLVALIGVGGVIAASFMGDKSQPYAGQTRQIALGSFGAIVLGAVLFLVRIMTGSGSAGGYNIKMSKFYNPGLGLFLALIAGGVGLLFLLGIIKFPDPKPKV